MTPRRLTTLYIKALTATWILVIVPLTMGAYSCASFQRRSEQHCLMPCTGSSSESRASICWECAPSNSGAQGASSDQGGAAWKGLGMLGPSADTRPIIGKAVDQIGVANPIHQRGERQCGINKVDGTTCIEPVIPKIAQSTTGIASGRHLEVLAANAAHLCGVPKKIFFSLIQRESSWRVDAVSSSGALGLAQIKPSTLRHVSPTLDPSRPFDRLVGAACYLRMQFDATQDWHKALHRYNAGPAGKVTEKVRNYARDIMEASNE